MEMNKTQTGTRLVTLRKGVRFALKQLSEDNLEIMPKGKASVAGVIKTLAEGKWFRPDLTDVPFCGLTDKGDDKASHVQVHIDVYDKLCKIAVNLGFDSLASMLEDFAGGVWELAEE